MTPPRELLDRLSLLDCLRVRVGRWLIGRRTWAALHAYGCCPGGGRR